MIAYHDAFLGKKDRCEELMNEINSIFEDDSDYVYVIFIGGEETILSNLNKQERVALTLMIIDQIE